MFGKDKAKPNEKKAKKKSIGSVYKKFAVIGLGQFGGALVKRLYEAGHEVVAIDVDLNLVEGISDFCTDAVCLDATDEKALRAQNLADMDTVIVAISDFENLISSTDLLLRLGVKNIMARYQSDLEVKILNMLGVSNLYNIEDKAARNMAEQFNHPSIRDNLIISGEYRITEITAPENLWDVPLLQSKLREKFNLNLITIKRVQKETPDSPSRDVIIGIPSADTTIQKDDILVVFGMLTDIEKFLQESL